ncbi:hypothetical protein [Streptomyces sp. NPDC008121]|uniref:hypothetical protein n=1 Tax=Streptomyces sp. NPDC008121 TaxID=3364809 RepID=UPI0036F0B598
MSASDQATPAKDTPVPDTEAETTEAVNPGAETAGTAETAAADTVDTAGVEDEAPGTDEEPEAGDAGAGTAGLTPKQARRLRIAAASVLLVAMAAVLVIRLASRTSVLVVGVYGLAMILCGVVIELSRNGRTRLATWLLVGGLAAALAFDWLILP